MITDTYTEALYMALKNGTPAEMALERIATILKREGHLPLYGRVLEETSGRLQKDETLATLTVRVARAEDAVSFKKQVDTVKEALGASHVSTVIDPGIVGGYIASGAEKQVDASYKRSLLSIYQALTA